MKVNLKFIPERIDLGTLSRGIALALTMALVLCLLSACGGGDQDSDYELREWCKTFVGPLTPEKQAECDRVLAGQ